MRLGMIFLAVAAAALAGAAPAGACSCRCPADAAALVRDTPIFFRGRPIAEAIVDNTRRYTFEVSAVHKGEAGPRLIVRTARHDVACGATFALGSETLVGAYLDADGPRTNLCIQYCIDRKRDEVERLLARCRPGAPCPPP